MQQVTLSLSSARPLSASLVNLVNDACSQVEDAGGDADLVIYLDGQSRGSGLWPYDVEIAVVNRWERALRRVERLPGVVVALADGDCQGVAAEALLVTDYRVAVAGSRFRLASRDGLTWPSMAVHRLANQIGQARSRPVVLLGTGITEEQALACHLIDIVVADRDAGAEHITATVAAQQGRELAVRRHLLLEAQDTGFDDALGSHLAACDRSHRLWTAAAAPGEARPEVGAVVCEE